MGFVFKSRKLDFVLPDGAPNPEYEGLEIYVKRVSIKKIRAVAEAADSIPDDIGIDNLEDAISSILSGVIKDIVRWNIEDENGAPVPISIESVFDYGGVDFSTDLLTTYINAMIGVSVPLEDPSGIGGSMAEELIPMEAL
jgi:hypothetical protein